MTWWTISEVEVLVKVRVSTLYLLPESNIQVVKVEFLIT